MESPNDRIVRAGEVVYAVGVSLVGGVFEVGRVLHERAEEFVVALGGVEVDALRERDGII